MSDFKITNEISKLNATGADQEFNPQSHAGPLDSRMRITPLL